MRERARREESVSRVRVLAPSYMFTFADFTTSFKIIRPMVSTHTTIDISGPICAESRVCAIRPSSSGERNQGAGLAWQEEGRGYRD